jgi:D-alanyl-D-alanine carboxypeptidase (penicillin-binding protein 5/6)
MMKRIVLFSCLFLFIFAPAYAYDAVETSAKQAIVVDFDTGAVLFGKNVDEQMPTSSMSKTLTIYEVFKALETGSINLDTTFPVSEKAWKKGGSKMFVEVGKQVSVEDLIRGVVVQSGNDATIVLAEGLSGTEEAFAARLNQTAQTIGLTKSHFANASGWPDPDHYSTARDLARLGRATIQDFPQYYHYYAEQDFTFNEINQPNRNPLLYRGIGADGIKTGHTEAGGYGLIGSGKRNGRRVVLVINGLTDETARAQESAKLLEWGLSRFENVTLHKENDVIGEAVVDLGKAKTVPVIVKDNIVVTRPKQEDGAPETSVRFKPDLVAPIRVGQELGMYDIKIPGQETLRYPLYANAAVEPVGFIAKNVIKAKRFVGGFVADKAHDIMDKTSNKE